MNYKNVVKNIRSELEKYILEHRISSLVLGVSGGIDSALCCVLAKPVCEKKGIPLIGVSIPIESNKSEEVFRAQAIGKNFCDHFTELNLTEYFFQERDLLWQTFGPQIVTTKQVNIANGNIKARKRMMTIYFIAGITNGMVLSTDNYSELQLGFWTLHGDVGDYGMIQNLWKTEVYGVSKYLIDSELHDFPEKQSALQDCVIANATDGLGVSTTTLQQLEAESWDEVDTILKAWLAGSKAQRGTPEYEEAFKYFNHPLVLRHIRSQFKRENPFNIPRDIIMKDVND